MAEKPDHRHESHHDLLAVVVEEVDEAREVLELAQQLVHALPLRSFEDVVKAVGTKGTINFRGSPRPVQNFAEHVPGILFPIDSVQKLVTLLYETVRLAPAWIKYNDNDPAYAKRKLRRMGILGLKQGLLGRGGGRSTGGRAVGVLSAQQTQKGTE
jgi:hypothetical protein